MFTTESYNSLIDLIREFPDDDTCRKHFEHIRWGAADGSVNPRCPHCRHTEKIYTLKGGKQYKCSACRKKFTVLVGTVFENTNIGLQKWFIAIYLVTSHKKGISSCQLAKDIGITQKSAWHMLHRIREMLRDKAPELLEGDVETDETFIGGKDGWKHKDKKVPNSRGRSTKAKTPVHGMVERGGKTRFAVVENTKADTLQSEIVPNVKPGSTVHSDEWIGYRGLSGLYDHEVIEHGAGEYVRYEKDKTVHTNTIENRWSHFRRTLTGTYHSVSTKHLHRYADESAFRLSTFEMEEGERFDLTIAGCEGKLTYEQLTRAPEWIIF